MDESNNKIKDIPSHNNKRVILCGSGGTNLSRVLMVERMREAFKDDNVAVISDAESAKVYLSEQGISITEFTEAVKDLYEAIKEAVVEVVQPAFEQLLTMSKEVNEYLESSNVEDREFRLSQRRDIYTMPKKQQQMQCRYNNKMQKKQCSKRRRTY